MTTQETLINASDLFVPEFNTLLKHLSLKEKCILMYAVFHNPYAPVEENDSRVWPILLHIAGITKEQYDVLNMFDLGIGDELRIVPSIIAVINSIESIKKGEGDMEDRMINCRFPFTKSRRLQLCNMTSHYKEITNETNLSEVANDFLNAMLNVMRECRIFK